MYCVWRIQSILIIYQGYVAGAATPGKSPGKLCN